MLQTCLIRGVADGIPNGSHACECGTWLRLLTGQEGLPGLSGEQVTSGSQVDKGEVKRQSSEGTASRVWGEEAGLFRAGSRLIRPPWHR